MKNSNPLLAGIYILTGISAGYFLSQKLKKGESEFARVAIGTIAGGLLGIMGAQLNLVTETTVYSQQAKLNEGLPNPTA